jgi:hypothetical protein
MSVEADPFISPSHVWHLLLLWLLLLLLLLLLLVLRSSGESGAGSWWCQGRGVADACHRPAQLQP